ncbi:MAG: tetratricopeptide repeat protein [Flavobacteriales bacterium]|nr:tetratricopeptide repeat protein [Flavobacteriales bacterium]
MKLYPQYFIFFLILVVVSCTKKTTINSSRNDSVEKYLKLASIDTLPVETRKKHNHKAFSFIDLEKNDSVVRWYLCDISWSFIRLRDSINYYESSKIYFEKAEKAKDTLNLARFFRQKSSFFSEKNNQNDSAFYYVSKSEKLFLKTSNYEGLTRVYLNKAQIQIGFNDFLGAELSLKKANRYVNDKDLIYEKYEVINGLGNIYSSIGKYKLAIESHKKAYNLSRKFKRVYTNSGEHYQGTSLNNIGNCYREVKDYTTALTYFKQALRDHKSLLKDKSLKAFLLNNIGCCYLKTNRLHNLHHIFKEAAKIFDSCGIKNEGAISRIYLAEYYAKINDTSTAIKYADKAVELAKESKSGYYYLYTLSNAGTIDKKKAPQYIAEYHSLNDSLLFEERKARNQYFKIQLETDEIAQEKEKAIKQKWVQTSIIASVLLIVILLFVIYKQQSQKKEFLLIQNQQKANEEIYQLMLQQQRKEEEAKQKEKKRIALELHDNVMNKLASTRFNLFTLTQQTNSENTNNARQHIQTIKEIEDEIRNLTHELSKEHFSEDNSFASLVAQFFNQQNKMHPTKYELQIVEEINWDIISSEIKMNLYRIIQEAIHNCNKYANATQVEINIIKESKQLQLSIKDNGIGFDTNEVKQGIGLHNMQQRIDSINGTITIHSTLGTGTEIKCTVTIKN